MTETMMWIIMISIFIVTIIIINHNKNDDVIACSKLTSHLQGWRYLSCVSSHVLHVLYGFLLNIVFLQKPEYLWNTIFSKFAYFFAYFVIFYRSNTFILVKDPKYTQRQELFHECQFIMKVNPSTPNLCADQQTELHTNPYIKYKILVFARLFSDVCLKNPYI